MIERGSPEWQRRMDGYLATCRQLIAEHGFMLQGVFGTDAEPVPFLLYTAGLTKAGRAELAMTGLPPEYGQVLLNTAAEQHLAAPLKLGRWICPATPQTSEVRLVVRRAGTEKLGIARRLYGSAKVVGLQLLWPDEQGHYPDSQLYTGVPQPLL